MRSYRLSNEPKSGNKTKVLSSAAESPRFKIKPDSPCNYCTVTVFADSVALIIAPKSRPLAVNVG